MNSLLESNYDSTKRVRYIFIPPPYRKGRCTGAAFPSVRCCPQYNRKTERAVVSLFPGRCAACSVTPVTNPAPEKSDPITEIFREMGYPMDRKPGDRARSARKENIYEIAG